MKQVASGIREGLVYVQLSNEHLVGGREIGQSYLQWNRKRASTEITVQDVKASGFQTLTTPLAVDLPKEEIARWCDRWQVRKLYLFGSVLRAEDYSDNSDIDVMMEFAPDARWGFEFVEMKLELEKLFERQVDLLTRASIEKSHNWVRHQEILGTAKLIYVAG